MGLNDCLYDSQCPTGHMSQADAWLWGLAFGVLVVVIMFGLVKDLVNGPARRRAEKARAPQEAANLAKFLAAQRMAEWQADQDERERRAEREARRQADKTHTLTPAEFLAWREAHQDRPD